MSVNQPQRFSLHEGLLLARHPASPTLPPKDPWWNLSTKEEDAADDQLETKVGQLYSLQHFTDLEVHTAFIITLLKGYGTRIKVSF